MPTTKPVKKDSLFDNPLETLKGIMATTTTTDPSPLNDGSTVITKEETAGDAEPTLRLSSNVSCKEAKPAFRKSISSKSAFKYRKHDKLEKTPMYIRLCSYFSYLLLYIVGSVREAIWGHGHVVDFFRKNKMKGEKPGYVPLYSSYESFYIRNVYRRLSNVFKQPIASVPGGKVTLIERESKDALWTFEMKPEDTRECVNFGSYNYLGYAENSGPCTEKAIEATEDFSLSSTSTRHEMGTTAVMSELEKTVATFLGTEDAITVGMGFATNSLNIPQLVGPGCLVVSDEKNHASLILGLRLAGATVIVFKHNNTDHLEKVLRKAIIQGQPRTRRPFKKAIIMVEGIYSMEGTIVKLPEIVEIKKKYGAYLYLDEAHSVGAMGKSGRGVVDYYGLNPKDIDILMGTFTKSFGSAGGYIAGSKALIDYLRINSQAFAYPCAMSAPVAGQIIAAMNQIMHKPDGMRRIKTLARNSRYMRRKLQQMGMIVYGHDDSPVVPVMLFTPAKVKALVDLLKERGVAAVAVGYPATKITEERSRLCVSASHTKEMLDQCLEALDQVGDELRIKYSLKNKYRDVEIKY